MLTDQLLSEIEAGQGETLKQAALRVPPVRQGRPVTLSCLLRWVTLGVPGPDGGRVKLEAGRLAGKWITTAAALRRFVAAQTPSLSLDCQPTPAPRAQAQRRKEKASN
jgi:hypothetical protein